MPAYFEEMRQTRRAAQQARDNLRAQLGGSQAPHDSDDGEFVVPEQLLEEEEECSDMFDEESEEEESDDGDMDEIIQEGIIDIVEQVRARAQDAGESCQNTIVNRPAFVTKAVTCGLGGRGCRTSTKARLCRVTWLLSSTARYTLYRRVGHQTRCAGR